MKNLNLGRNSLAVYAALAITFLMIPIVYTIAFSFNDSGRSNASWVGFTFDKWLNVCADQGVCAAVSNSILVGVVSTVLATAIGTAAGLLPAQAFGSASVPTASIQTTLGKVRGLREGAISAFRGIPYGADTGGLRRFLPPVKPEAWGGSRDCFTFGHRAPQSSVSPGRIPPGADMAKLSAMMAAFKDGQVATGNESEDCLVLNVFTPDASTATKRPVLFWLHGGGFAMGSAGEPVYEGGVLAQRGDVVVVTINHRLGAPGYLYLGGFDPAFRHSGTAGQLDQILALEWVRDNIAQFGGDPGNVTIFGESGGGAKVSTLLAMPAAQGLFHKAIIQSGPSLKAISANDATDFAARALKVLDIAPDNARAVQQVPLDVLMKAALDAQAQMPPGGAMRVLAPVVDGVDLPNDPFDPAAPETARKVPVMIGSTKDEATLFSIADPKFGTMTEDDAKARFAMMLKGKGEKAFGFYRAQRPKEGPTWLVTSMMTESGTWINSIRLAERKLAQGAAPVFMYRLDYETPIFGGVLRAPHGLDTPMVFGHAQEFARMLGTGPVPQRISGQMMDAWIAFARTGNPSTRALAWPAYDTAKRSTMIFAGQSHVTGDPDKPMREFWAS